MTLHHHLAIKRYLHAHPLILPNGQWKPCVCPARFRDTKRAGYFVQGGRQDSRPSPEHPPRVIRARGLLWPYRLLGGKDEVVWPLDQLASLAFASDPLATRPLGASGNGLLGKASGGINTRSRQLKRPLYVSHPRDSESYHSNRHVPPPCEPERKGVTGWHFDIPGCRNAT